jgi:Fe-S cluster assembly protein SufB
MSNQSNKILNTNITNLVNQPYKYGFYTMIEKEIIEKGINKKIIKLISKKKKRAKVIT